jgi:hypothetical protein
MIKGFEKETEELNEYELNVLLPVLLKHLPEKIGPDKSVTSNLIIAGLKKRGYKINGARLRKLINHIRRHNLIPLLIASSKGYYISIDDKDTQRFIDSLQQREDAIRTVRIAIQHQQQSKTNTEITFPNN